MQRQTIGSWLGLGLLLAGCGSPLPATVGAPPHGEPGRGIAPRTALPEAEARPLVDTRVSGPLAPTAGPIATESLVITFQNPRTSFSSDKFDLSTGKTLPVDDGMGPEGDLSFFFDGTRFQVIANAGGGANRTIAPAKAGKPIDSFAMAPIPLKEGSEVLIKQDHGLYAVTITGLQAGSMSFLPTGTGTGTGSVTFTYRPLASSSI